MARIVSATPSTLVRTIERQCSGDSSRKPRWAPKPALANDGVDAAEALERRLAQRLDVVPVGDVAAHGQRPLLAAELRGQLDQLVLAPRAEHQPVAALGARAAVAAPMPLEAPVIRRTAVAIAIARDSRHCDNRGAMDPARKRRSASSSRSRRRCCWPPPWSTRRSAPRPRRASPRTCSPLARATPTTSPARSSPDSIERTDERLAFRISDRDGSSALPVTYSGTVPTPSAMAAR